jgi:hypothetical protein
MDNKPDRETDRNPRPQQQPASTDTAKKDNKTDSKPDRTLTRGEFIAIMLVVAFCILVGVMAGRNQLIAFILHNRKPGTLLAILAIAGIFPISALAYQVFQRETQLKELERDFGLLVCYK